MKPDPHAKNSAFKNSAFNSPSTKSQPPRQDRSQEMSGANDHAKPSDDTPKPHGDPLRDTLMGRKH